MISGRLIGGDRRFDCFRNELAGMYSSAEKGTGINLPVGQKMRIVLFFEAIMTDKFECCVPQVVVYNRQSPKGYK